MNTTLDRPVRREFRNVSPLPQRRVHPFCRRSTLARYSAACSEDQKNEALYLGIYLVTMFATCAALVLGA